MNDTFGIEGLKHRIQGLPPLAIDERRVAAFRLGGSPRTDACNRDVKRLHASGSTLPADTEHRGRRKPALFRGAGLCNSVGSMLGEGDSSREGTIAMWRRGIAAVGGWVACGLLAGCHCMPGGCCGLCGGGTCGTGLVAAPPAVAPVYGSTTAPAYVAPAAPSTLPPGTTVAPPSANVGPQGQVIGGN